MNDFTKDELIILRRLVLHHVDQFRENSDCIELMRKIRSMIDNYHKTCKHTSTNFDDGIYYCDECGHCVP